MKFTTTIFQQGNNTGIEVPPAVVEQLDAGKKPPVVVMLKGYTYRSTIAVMGGKFLIPLSAERRAASGVKGGDVLEVQIELDTQPRTVTLPTSFGERLKQNEAAATFFQTLAPSLKKKIVLLIESAKTEETRNKRIAKIMADLEQNKNHNQPIRHLTPSSSIPDRIWRRVRWSGKNRKAGRFATQTSINGWNNGTKIEDTRLNYYCKVSLTKTLNRWKATYHLTLKSTRKTKR